MDDQFQVRNKRQSSSNTSLPPQARDLNMNHQISMSSMHQSPMKTSGGMASGGINHRLFDEDHNMQPIAMAQPPQMTMQHQSSFPFQTNQEAPFYYELKQIQESVSNSYPTFPLQANKDFFDCNYDIIVRVAATQIEFLFQKLQQKTMHAPMQLLDNGNNTGGGYEMEKGTGIFKQSSASFDNDSFLKIRSENQAATQSIQMLKTSLSKADDIVKNLRIENEYFQRQLETLRGEVEQAKKSSFNRPRSLDRNSGGAPLENNDYGFGLGYAGHRESSQYEPQMNLPMPMPHPRPAFHNLMEEGNDDQPCHSNYKRSPRNSSAGNTAPRLRNTSNGQTPTAPAPAVSKRSTANSANGRKGKKALQQMDENVPVDSKDQGNDQDLRSLKFELQQQSEVLMLKTETVRNLQEQLDVQKRKLTTEASKIQGELQSEVEGLRKELELIKDDELSKEAQLGELRRQCIELVKSRSIEVNVLMNKPKEVVLEMTNEKVKPGRGGGVAMTKASKNLLMAKELNREMELMFAEDDDFKPSKPVRKGKKKDKRQQVHFGPNQDAIQSAQNLAIGGNTGSVQGNSLSSGILPQDAMLRNQIQAALLAETMIDEIKAKEMSQNNEVSDLQMTCDSLQVHSKTMMEEKKNLGERVTELSIINDDLKRKFSSLLDQFQEYVTLQETKQATDEESKKSQQETLLQNMQENIRELEHVTESLQQELQNKENVFEVLKKENKELEHKLNTKAAEENHNAQQAMRRLEDELSFLKRHHDLEINMLKEQYDRSLETAKLIAMETSNLKERPGNGAGVQSQLQNELLASQSNISNCGKTESVHLSDNQPYQPPHQQIHQQYQQDNISQGGYYPAGGQSSYHGTGGPSSPFKNNRAKDMLQTTQDTFERLKQDLTEKEHLLEEKNREILRLRMDYEEAIARQLGKQQRQQQQEANFGQVNCEQRGQLIADLSYSIDTLRAELTRTKQTMFAQIGKHINFEVATHMQNQQRMIQTEEDLHSEVVIQLSEIRALNSLAQELNMLSQSSLTNNNYRQRSNSPGMSPAAPCHPVTKPSHDSNYQIKRSADQMLRQNHTSGLHELLMEQVTKSETLMGDNALMQRQLYKYETTLAELDVILRGDKRDQSIFELKKLVEQQLKQIIILQKEVELARRGQASGGALTPTKIAPVQVAEANPKELENLKYQLSEQRAANEELLAERRGCMEMIENLEGQAKESHRNMEKALDKVGGIEKDLNEKTTELEDIRERITKVAELFERKEIKQKYSFEVLCDFIHDKAKRLFAKYESASKERKVMQEEKNFYFQRKLDQLEQENFSMKETNRAAERIIHELLPNLSQLLERPVIASNELSEYYYARSVLEQVEIQFRTLKKSQNILQERNNELGLQLDAIRGHQKSSAIENCAPNNQYQNSTFAKNTLQQSSTLQQQNTNEDYSHWTYQQQQPRSTSHRSQFDQKLSEAKAQEQQEILAAQKQQQTGNTSPILSGHGTVAWSALNNDQAASPDRGHSPLRTGQMPRGEEMGLQHREMGAGGAHTRTKSFERDNKDSPQRQIRASALGGPYQGGTIGSHLTHTDKGEGK